MGVIHGHDLPPTLQMPQEAADPGSTGRLHERVAVLEQDMISDALKRSAGNVSAAARELGMHKSTLFRKVRLLGIELPVQDGRSLRKVGSVE